MIYKISLPVKLSYVIDDIELHIQNVEELEHLQDKYDVDLQYLIDEYEYKLEAEENYLGYDDDGEKSDTRNNLELLHSVIEDNIQNIIEKFNKEYDLSAMDNKSLVKLFKIAQDDFNSKFVLQDQPGQYVINSVLINGYDATNSFFVIEVDVNRELTQEELLELKSLVDNKCTEEWGTQFEKNDFSDLLEEDMMYVYVKCWDADTPIDFINI